MTDLITHVALLHETRQRHTCHIRDLTVSTRTCRSLIEDSLLKLEEMEMLALEGELVTVGPEERLRIAEHAILQGADPEHVARGLRWQEFESLANQVLLRNGFATLNHFVFKSQRRRFEIDVVGAREPVVLCIDCKHWHHGWAPSRIASAARNQILRVIALLQVFPAYLAKLSLGNWRSVRFLPIVITLADVSSRLVDGVPVVSALRFRAFLSELSPWAEKLRFFDARLPSLISDRRT